MQENSGKENQYGKKRARIQRNYLNQNLKKIHSKLGKKTYLGRIIPQRLTRKQHFLQIGRILHNYEE